MKYTSEHNHQCYQPVLKVYKRFHDIQELSKDRDSTNFKPFQISLAGSVWPRDNDIVWTYDYSIWSIFTITFEKQKRDLKLNQNIVITQLLAHDQKQSKSHQLLTDTSHYALFLRTFLDSISEKIEIKYIHISSPL